MPWFRDLRPSLCLERIWRQGVALMVLALLAVFVWPTRYKYESLKMGANTVTIRTDRFSDRTWMLVAVRPLRSLSAKL
jgi:hypothetical protein